MRILFAGTPELAVPSLRALTEAGHEVVGVITREDAPLGRRRVLTPSPVAQAASELGVPLHQTNRPGAETTTWAADLHADLGVIVAYGGLLREPLLSLPTLGWINLHFSDLPRWRGAAPVQRALMAGEQSLGVTVFRLVEALDAGAVLGRDAQHFPPGTSAGHALTSLSEFGTKVLLRAIEELERDPDAGAAQLGEPTYAHKLDRADSRLDLSAPIEHVLAHWAGVTPEPGATAEHDGDPVKLQEVRPLAGPGDPGADAPAPGTVQLENGRAILHLHGGALELHRVQPAGKPVMDGAAWLRGRGGWAVLK